MDNNIIREAVLKAIITEAEKSKADLIDECESMISEIRKKLNTLNSKLSQLGLPQDSKPYMQFKKMNHILASYDPIELNMKEYFTPKTEMASEKMVGESDVKMDVESDKETEKKAMELSKDYGMDIQLTDEEQ